MNAGWLEQLNGIAGRVVEQDLRAAGSGDDVVAEVHAGLAEAFDLGREVVDDEVDAVPSPGRGWLPSGMGRPAELAGPLSSRRRWPRRTSAKAGAALEMTLKPKWVV